MSKRTLVTLIIFLILGVLTGIMFGTVFCLRSQTVTVLGETPVDISKEEIISAAGIKNSQSIFMIDKEKAIANIEAKHAKIKVVQIKTISVTEIEIRVRARHEMFYTEYNKNFYVMDEELKVLNIVAESEEGGVSNKPTNLIEIPATNLNINASTLKCDFVGGSAQNAIYELYHAIINNVKNVEDGKNVFYSRADVVDVVKKVELVQFSSFTKILIKTKYGVMLDIENPNENMTEKMNICFSAIKHLQEEGKQREQSGTIKIYYKLDNTQVNVYIPENNQGE